MTTNVNRAAAGIVVAAVLAVVAVLAFAGGGHHAQPVSHPASRPAPAVPDPRPRPPSTVVPSQSPVQVQIDQELAQAIASVPGLAAATAYRVPSPAVGGGWPTLPVADTAERWAPSFVAALLDIDYARQSRPALGGWLQAEEAPYLLPGMPAAAADKTLALSLLEPSLLGETATPVMSAARWAANARAGVRQHVSGLLAQADPRWAQLVAQGWQPADQRMTAVDVSGLLTVTRGHTSTVSHFGLVLYVGSARWHAGYGTVTVTSWTESR